MKRSEDVGWYRHCREDEGSKAEMLWTRNKEEMKESWSETL